jgi:hypothetical protein
MFTMIKATMHCDDYVVHAMLPMLSRWPIIRVSQGVTTQIA